MIGAGALEARAHGASVAKVRRPVSQPSIGEDRSTRSITGRACGSAAPRIHRGSAACASPGCARGFRRLVRPAPPAPAHAARAPGRSTRAAAHGSRASRASDTWIAWPSAGTLGFPRRRLLPGRRHRHRPGDAVPLPPHAATISVAARKAFDSNTRGWVMVLCISELVP